MLSDLTVDGGGGGNRRGRTSFLGMLQQAEQRKPIKSINDRQLQNHPAAFGYHQEANFRHPHLRRREEQEKNLAASYVTAEDVSPPPSTERASSPEKARKRKKKKTQNKQSKIVAGDMDDTQRMSHIAVERNRRRVMNAHLAALRRLMPPSYIPHGDQASIVGGAIDFVKELEHLLLSLHVEKRMRDFAGAGDREAAAAARELLMVSPQYMGYSAAAEEEEEGVDVEVTVVREQASLKVLGRRRRPAQLVGAVAAMEEELGLSVLRLDVASICTSSVFYSFNLKMEDGSKMWSADEIADAANRIFCRETNDV